MLLRLHVFVPNLSFMARPREFEIEDVLAKAREVFWRSGYAATSMSDVYAATGLKPGSMYAVFKDKEELFRRVLLAYADRFRSSLPKNEHGLAAIEAWLRLQAGLACEDPQRRGCLLINTVTERTAHSAATQAIALGNLQEARNFFLSHLRTALEKGEIQAPADIEAQADALLGTVVSIMGLARAGCDPRVIWNVALAPLKALKASI